METIITIKISQEEESYLSSGEMEKNRIKPTDIILGLSQYFQEHDDSVSGILITSFKKK